MYFKQIPLTKTKSLLVFETGQIYSVDKDVVSLLKIKVETQIEKKTFKFYKSSYVYFNYRKFSPAKLVANCFIENANGYKKIRRKDNNVLNNSSANLYWSLDNKDYLDKKAKTIDRNLVDYDSLCDLNKAIYNYIVKGEEKELYLSLFKGDMRKYLWKSFYDRGLPEARFETFLDIGYSKLQERLIQYYYFQNNDNSSVKKYIFLTMYFSALIYNKKEKRINLDFIPRELKNKQQYYYEISLEDFILSAV
ncbi:hypothetical protein HZP42_15675 [Elizabethkingia anophelis]|nr:hypothetical protein [Elizabethkingia anophelis]